MARNRYGVLLLPDPVLQLDIAESLRIAIFKYFIAARLGTTIKPCISRAASYDSPVMLAAHSRPMREIAILRNPTKIY
jgi:hypothetical protein